MTVQAQVPGQKGNRVITLERLGGLPAKLADLKGRFDSGELLLVELTSPEGKRVVGTDGKVVTSIDTNQAKNLYRYLFPDRDEAEPWYAAIMPRLREMLNLPGSKDIQKQYGDSRFHVAVILAKIQEEYRCVGFTQWSTLPIGRNNGGVFWQYGGVADATFLAQEYGVENSTFRRQGLGRLMWHIRNALSLETLRSVGRTGRLSGGTIIESEFPGQSEAGVDAQLYTIVRLAIHAKEGSGGLVFETKDGRWLSAHLQPALSASSDPITLGFLTGAAAGRLNNGPVEISIVQAQDIAMGLLRNFRREQGFNSGVRAAYEVINDRIAQAKDGGKALIVPWHMIPDVAQMAEMDPVIRSATEPEVLSSTVALRPRLEELKARLRAGEIVG